MEITEKQFNGIVRKAFKLGEQWGITYQGWFTPSKAECRKKINIAIKETKRHLICQNIKLHTDVIKKNTFAHPTIR